MTIILDGKGVILRLLACLLALGFSLNVSGKEICIQDEGCTRLTGIGIAAVSAGDDTSFNQRQIAAIRAAKLEALRALAEQLTGVRLQSKSTLAAAAMTHDSVETSVDTTLKGVRYVSVQPVQRGIYQAIAEIDVRPTSAK